jgi:hypothetical protein
MSASSTPGRGRRTEFVPRRAARGSGGLRGSAGYGLFSCLDSLAFFGPIISCQLRVVASPQAFSIPHVQNSLTPLRPIINRCPAPPPHLPPPRPSDPRPFYSHAPHASRLDFQYPYAFISTNPIPHHPFHLCTFQLPQFSDLMPSCSALVPVWALTAALGHSGAGMQVCGLLSEH